MTDRSVLWRIHFHSPPEEVYRALATDDGRRRFWAEEAPERDGAIDFTFQSGLRMRAPLLRREPPRLFELEYFGCLTRFELAPSDGGTDLTLVAEGVPEEDYEDVLPGWVSVLLQMKAAVDHGIDLRTHDPSRSWDQRYVDQ